MAHEFYSQNLRPGTYSDLCLVVPVTGGSRPARGHKRLAVVVGLVVILLALLVSASGAKAAGGSVQAWGRNDVGQLGTGSPTTTGCGCITSPTPVSGLSSVVAIAGGFDHSLALLSDGTVRAWGDNANGQLGNGTTNPSSTPIPVPGLSSVVAIAASSEGHLSMALRSNGTVLAWGANDSGQLGDGTTNATGCMCITAPTPVSGLSHVVAISAGDNAGMALLTDGTVRSWGANGSGNLGNGAPTTTGCRCIPTPVAAKGLSRVVAIAEGTYNGLALLAGGTVRAWGWNEAGELGIGTVGTTGCACRASPVKVSALSHVTAIADGYENAMALLQSGSVRGWGFNVDGEVGNGTPTTTGCDCVDSPVAVSGLSNAAAIAPGGQHDLVLLKNRTAMAWGTNGYGQVGNGTNITTGCQCIPSATTVDALGGASALAGGFNHSLAITGPAQTLKVKRVGAGTGTVGGAVVVCGQSCSKSYPQGSYAWLRAVPSIATKFAGFTGACTGIAACRVQMSTNRSVVATFGPPKGTQITAATVSKKKRSASFSFTAPGAITGFQCALVKNKTGTKPKFSRCAAPEHYKKLKPGHYSFEVRARDRVGADPHPAKHGFKI